MSVDFLWLIHVLFINILKNVSFNSYSFFIIVEWLKTTIAIENKNPLMIIDFISI